jgi:hypothetical protein
VKVFRQRVGSIVGINNQNNRKNAFNITSRASFSSSPLASTPLCSVLRPNSITPVASHRLVQLHVVVARIFRAARESLLELGAENYYLSPSKKKRSAPPLIGVSFLALQSRYLSARGMSE